MNDLFRNIRFYTLISAFALSAGIYFWSAITIHAAILQISRLVEWFGLISLVYTYLALLAGPFCYTFKQFSYSKQFLHSRRALGVSAFYFALLHTIISFFGELGGFSGLSYLGNTYLAAVIIGFSALFILFILTVTSLDYAVEKLTFPKWKLLHRTTYIAGILILIHTLMLGSHFSDLNGLIPQITFVGLAFLLFLEAPRFDIYMRRWIPIPSFGLSFFIVGIIVTGVFFTVINPISQSGTPVSFDIHAAHKQLAALAQQNSSSDINSKFANIPGLNGDRTKRYTVGMTTEPVNPEPNQDTTIHFQIYDANSGNPVYFFKTLYAYPMHFMIVDSTLMYFEHIHPTQEGNVFSITTQFPNPGMYHLYIQFQPFGGIEQQMAFTLPVGIGKNDTVVPSTQPVDTKFTKVFEDYEVTLNTHGELNAQEMSLGNETISFTIKDAKTKKPITTLKPYMAAFGHLTMINEKTYDFIHVHPYNLTIPKPDANGGPTVDFLPIGIYGPFKPGIYRAFGEFSTKVGTDFDTNFTIEIK